MSTNTPRGQATVVTGASSGIGLAVARELHSLGLKLVLSARSEDRLGRISDRLAAAAVAADITEATVPDRLLAIALERYGRCAVVINNAGAIEAVARQREAADRRRCARVHGGSRIRG